MSHCTSAVISYVSHSQHCTADKLGRPHTHNVIVTREAPRVKFPVLVKHPCKLRLDRTRKKQSGDISHQFTILSVLKIHLHQLPLDGPGLSFLYCSRNSLSLFIISFDSSTFGTYNSNTRTLLSDTG